MVFEGGLIVGWEDIKMEEVGEEKNNGKGERELKSTPIKLGCEPLEAGSSRRRLKYHQGDLAKILNFGAMIRR